MIDFSNVHAGEMKYAELAATVDVADLQPTSDASIDAMLAVIASLTDADIVFAPRDEKADDPYAVAGEEAIGWSIGHLIAHVTASSEEGAAFFSVLARGHALAERPRVETPWREIDTVAKCKQRLEESRRIRNGYLQAIPDTPNLDVLRAGMPEGFLNFTGPLNAIGCFVLGLGHETEHFAQLEAAATQAIANR